MIFWLLMILWFVFGLVVTNESGWNRRFIAGGLLLFVLLFLLGWKVFGFVVQ